MIASATIISVFTGTILSQVLARRGTTANRAALTGVLATVGLFVILTQTLFG